MVVLSVVSMLFLAPASAGAIVQLSGDSLSRGTTEVAAIEFAFRELVNEERAAAGLQPLTNFDDLIDDARIQAVDMVNAGYLYHNPNLANVTASENWFKLGENVGFGPNVDVLHEAFMESESHAANVLKDVYNYIGVGVVVDGNDRIWVAVVFMYGPEGVADGTNQGPEQYVAPFSDDDNSTHEAAIRAIYEAGITSGCSLSGDRFCPIDTVTRAQMATFLDGALKFPAATRDYFSDDNGSVHEDAINRLAEAGITGGCGDDQYCPEDLISRAHMAVFLDRALDLPSVDDDFFEDDDNSAYEGSINALAAYGVTSGCGGESYCPTGSVTRGQMATFLARALNLI